MTAQHHITTHHQQGMLRAQARLQLALRIGADGQQRLLALGQLLLRGVVPLFPPLLFSTLQVLFQILYIADHQLVALLAGKGDDLVSIEIIVRLLTA